MSFTVMTGFRFAESSLDAAYARIEAFRPRLARLRADATARVLAKKATDMIDARACAALSPEPVPQGADRPLPTARADLHARARRIDRERRRDPEADFSFEVTLHPVAGDVLCVLFTDRRDWQAVWEAHGGAEPWGYWDNTDPPDDVSPDAWEARRQAWQAAFAADRHGRPGLSGLTVRLFDTLPDQSDIADILAQVPSLAARLRATTRWLYRARRMQEALSACAESPPASRMISLLTTIDREMDTPDGAAALHRLTREVQPRLPVIDRSHLMGA